MSLTELLYRYIFRGAGIVFAVGVLTALIAAAWGIYHIQQEHAIPPVVKSSSVPAHPASGGKRSPQ